MRGGLSSCRPSLVHVATWGKDTEEEEDGRRRRGGAAGTVGKPRCPRGLMNLGGEPTWEASSKWPRATPR